MKKECSIFVLALVMCLGAAVAQNSTSDDSGAASQAAASPQPCSADEYRQFDFWLGAWDVRSKAQPDRPPARNVITSAHSGCLVHEQYVAGAYNGSSLNFYRPSTKSWHQTWIDNSGTSLFLQGGLNEKGEMVLTSDRALSPIQRITWTPKKNGEVRQHWQQSSDGGKTWTTAFDGTYTKVSD